MDFIKGSIPQAFTNDDSGLAQLYRLSKFTNSLLPKYHAYSKALNCHNMISYYKITFDRDKQLFEQGIWFDRPKMDLNLC